MKSETDVEAMIQKTPMIGPCKGLKIRNVIKDISPAGQEFCDICHEPIAFNFVLRSVKNDKTGKVRTIKVCNRCQRMKKEVK